MTAAAELVATWPRIPDGLCREIAWLLDAPVAPAERAA